MLVLGYICSVYQLCQKAAVLMRRGKKERLGLAVFISGCIYFLFFSFRPLEIRTLVLVIPISFFAELAAGRILQLNNQDFRNYYKI